MPNKDEAYWRILNSAILLDMRWGHQKWSIALLARTSRVARSLIYYYFGRSKFDILVHAVKLIGLEFAGGTKQRHELWEQGHYADTLLKSREMLAQTPALIPFYDMNRGKENEIGELIRAHEQSFKKKIRQFFPYLNAEQNDALFAIFVGIVFSGVLDERGVREATEIALRGVASLKNS